MDTDVRPASNGALDDPNGGAAPEYLRKIAWETDTLIAKFDGMPRSRDMVRDGIQGQVQKLEEQREWEARRQKHFEETVPADPRLCDEEAGRPAEGWGWDHYYSSGHGETAPGRVQVAAWAPPDLFMTKQRGTPEANAYDLLPLRDDRALSLSEEYTVLAIIHDAICKGRQRIYPWANRPEMAEINLDEFGKRVCYASFVEHCRDPKTRPRMIRASDAGALRAMLRTVGDDLEDYAVSEWEKSKPRIGFYPDTHVTERSGHVGNSFGNPSNPGHSPVSA